MTLSKPVDKTNLLKLQASQQAGHLIVSSLDTDLNLLLANGSVIHPTAAAAAAAVAATSNPIQSQLLNIPLTFADPNLQFNHLIHQQQHSHLSPLNLPALNATQLNIPK